MGGFEIPKLNMFQQPIQQIGAIGTKHTGAATGSHKTGAAGGQTPFEADMADFRKYLPQNNGTGELIPKNDSKLCFMA